MEIDGHSPSNPMLDRSGLPIEIPEFDVLMEEQGGVSRF